MSELGRLVPDIPRWTSVEREGRKSTEFKDTKADGGLRPRKKLRVQSGLRFVGGARWWCYLCGSEHKFGDPCIDRRRPQLLSVVSLPTCEFCGNPIPESSGRRQYCRELCRDDAKLLRRRLARLEAS